MTVTRKILNLVSRLPEGEVFNYDQLKLEPSQYRAAVKALGRLTETGLVKRASTGKYYKPQKTVFGELRPGEDELLKSYLFENGRRIAYITGDTLYNKLGLTTQVPKTIRVASRDKRVITKLGPIQIKPIKSYVDVTDQNFHLLEMLDAIKDFKKIPDLNREDGVKRLKQLLQALKKEDIGKLIRIAMKYPPRVRAFTGAMLNSIGTDTGKLTPLLRSINPLSKYNFGISQKDLPGTETWNII